LSQSYKDFLGSTLIQDIDLIMFMKKGYIENALQTGIGKKESFKTKSKSTIKM